MNRQRPRPGEDLAAWLAGVLCDAIRDAREGGLDQASVRAMLISLAADEDIARGSRLARPVADGVVALRRWAALRILRANIAGDRYGKADAHADVAERETLRAVLKILETGEMPDVPPLTDDAP